MRAIPETTLACSRDSGKDHSLKSCPSVVYRRIKRRLGRTLRGLYCKRQAVRHRKSPLYQFPAAKGSFLGPQEFQASLRASDCIGSNGQHDWLPISTKRYEIRLSLCPPLEASVLLPSQGIVLRARHIPGCLNVIADKLSRHNQVIQTEWSLSQQLFNLLCSKWARPQLDLFATRFNHKLPRFVSPVPDQKAWAVDTLSLPWKDLDVYTFPPVSLLNQVVSKVMDQGCHRMILIAPGWPNMPWFWGLVNLSVQIPFVLPLQSDLVTQPFNRLPHRDLKNLNLHAWLLEPLSFRNKWQLL